MQIWWDGHVHPRKLHITVWTIARPPNSTTSQCLMEARWLECIEYVFVHKLRLNIRLFLEQEETCQTVATATGSVRSLSVQSEKLFDSVSLEITHRHPWNLHTDARGDEIINSATAVPTPKPELWLTSVMRHQCYCFDPERQTKIRLTKMRADRVNTGLLSRFCNKVSFNSRNYARLKILAIYFTIVLMQEDAWSRGPGKARYMSGSVKSGAKLANESFEFNSLLLEAIRPISDQVLQQIQSAIDASLHANTSIPSCEVWSSFHFEDC